jgi:hypothetical protein
MEQHFREQGLSNVKSLVDQWSGLQQAYAREWIAQEERRIAEREEEHKTEQLNISRAAKEEVATANAFASDANQIAKESNIIAREAAISASKSAAAARTNNWIAVGALIASIIAVVISIVSSIRH